jgi:uncharacterized membrane protein
MEPSPYDVTTVAVDPRQVSYTHLMYGLHAIAVLMGILTAASIVGQFLFSLPSIIAVIMNYARRSAVRDTWLASHFSWQLRTFWWSFGWMALAWLLFGPLLLIFIGYPLLVLSALIVGAWVAYRILRGWMALAGERRMPV